MDIISQGNQSNLHQPIAIPKKSQDSLHKLLVDVTNISPDFNKFKLKLSDSFEPHSTLQNLASILTMKSSNSEELLWMKSNKLIAELEDHVYVTFVVLLSVG